MDDQEWLTIAQAAARAGISPARIRHLLHTNRIKFVRSKPGAHDTRIDPASLAVWQATRRPGRPRHTQATIPPPAPVQPVCVCCGTTLANRRRGRPRLHCTDCIIAGCSPKHGARHSLQEMA